jgi:hypothetical protein
MVKCRYFSLALSLPTPKNKKSTVLNLLLSAPRYPLLSNNGQNVAVPRMSALCQSRPTHRSK